MSATQIQGPVTVTLTVGGMHCPACANRVTKALKSLPGVAEAAVSLEQRQATVTYDPAVLNAELLQQAVVEAGYTVEATS
jgi:copper chaperone CopZ